VNPSKPVNSLLKASMAVMLLGIGCGPPPETQVSPPAPSQADLFVSGEDGYHTYRIPALIVTRQGSLLAFCEGRKNNRRDHGDIDLLLDIGDNISPGPYPAAAHNGQEAVPFPPRQTTICPLGPSAVAPVVSTIRRFRHEYESKITRRDPIPIEVAVAGAGR